MVLDQNLDSGGFGQKIGTPVVLDQNWDSGGFGQKIGTPVVSDQNWVPSSVGPFALKPIIVIVLTMFSLSRRLRGDFMVFQQTKIGP